MGQMMCQVIPGTSHTCANLPGRGKVLLVRGDAQTLDRGVEHEQLEAQVPVAEVGEIKELAGGPGQAVLRVDDSRACKDSGGCGEGITYNRYLWMRSAGCM